MFIALEITLKPHFVGKLCLQRRERAVIVYVARWPRPIASLSIKVLLHVSRAVSTSKDTCNIRLGLYPDRF